MTDNPEYNPGPDEGILGEELDQTLDPVAEGVIIEETTVVSGDEDAEDSDHNPGPGDVPGGDDYGRPVMGDDADPRFNPGPDDVPGGDASIQERGDRSFNPGPPA